MNVCEEMPDNSGFEDVKQVQGRGLRRRGMRLEWMAGWSAALAVAALPAVAVSQEIATETTLQVSTTDRAGQTMAAVKVSVTDENGQPATGAVNLEDGDRILAQLALNAAGRATTTVRLPGGQHLLSAVYQGDATHWGSSSPVAESSGAASTTPNFQVTVTPVSPSSFPMVLTQGQSGTSVVTITPENNASLASPMFVTLSCSGLPNESSCTFTPENVEILADTPASCPAGSPASSCPPISTMLLQTQAPGTVARAVPGNSPGGKNNAVEWAILLPGVLGMGALAWGTRRRRVLNRLFALTLMLLATTLGVTGCSPLYRYYQHGPGNNPPTPTGTYNVEVTAQSSNGVTAITNSTTIVLTVK